jgi:hypothetical protein
MGPCYISFRGKMQKDDLPWSGIPSPIISNTFVHPIPFPDVCARWSIMANALRAKWLLGRVSLWLIMEKWLFITNGSPECFGAGQI